MYTYYRLEMVKNRIMNRITKNTAITVLGFTKNFTTFSIFAKTRLKINFSLDRFSSLQFHDM